MLSMLAPLEIILKRTDQQRFPKTVRTGQKVIQVRMGQLIDKVSLVYIIHAVFANSREILHADGKFL